MSNTTVMEHNDEKDLRTILEEQYQEAVIQGFTGTFEEYLQYRDYT